MTVGLYQWLADVFLLFIVPTAIQASLVNHNSTSEPELHRISNQYRSMDFFSIFLVLENDFQYIWFDDADDCICCNLFKMLYMFGCSVIISYYSTLYYAIAGTDRIQAGCIHQQVSLLHISPAIYISSSEPVIIDIA